jgi:2-iminobutanoate/2-iminopropanoate deaminase
VTVKKYADAKADFGGATLWYSKVVRAGDFWFLSGQPGADKETGVGQGDARAQTRIAFRNAEAVLAGVGLTLEDIVKVTVYLGDARDFLLMNIAMREIFTGDPPARVTVVAQPVLDTKIEIDVVAYKES